MRHQSHKDAARLPIDAGSQMAQLRNVLHLVGEIAGRGAASGTDDKTLDEAARISSAYHEAEPIVRRRFDILAAETASWSAAGVEALLAAGETRSPAAAARLAEELEQALTRLSGMLAPSAKEASGATPSP
jgi:hypothetical protein